jgi:phage N-6-adenine-methyltransferase
MRKKPEWTSCGGLVVCTACGSDEMEMCDVRVRSKVYKRETRCLGCGDRQTTPITAPELPSASKLAQAIADGPGQPEVKTKLIGALEAAGAGDMTTAGRLASQAIAANEPDHAASPKRRKAPSAGAVVPEVKAVPSHQIISLSDIYPDSVQPRAQMDMMVVAEYAEQMQRAQSGKVGSKLGVPWPPIEVYRKRGEQKVRLADGFHRVKAAELADCRTFQAVVYEGDARDALLHGLGANRTHGARMTNADKRRVVTLALDDPEWSEESDTEIAARCGVTQPFVSKLRAERRERDQPAEQVKREDEEPRERSDNGYGEESEPAPLQFDLVESIAARQRRQEEEEEEAAERRAEAEKKRIEQEQRDSWSTPPEFLESIVRPILETIDLDAASNEAAQAVVQAERWFSLEDDALAQEWGGNVWLNPPYSHPLVERFALKAIEEFKSGRVKQLLVLVNSSTSSVWWHELARACAMFAFPLGRLSFWSPHGLDGDNNRSPQTLFYFGHRDLFALHHLRDAGYIAVMSPNY